MDCDRRPEGCGLDTQSLEEELQHTLEEETELLRTYTILSERIRDNEELKNRLRNFAEGNAKRSLQLQEELSELTASAARTELEH